MTLGQMQKWENVYSDISNSKTFYYWCWQYCVYPRVMKEFNISQEDESTQVYKHIKTLEFLSAVGISLKESDEIFYPSVLPSGKYRSSRYYRKDALKKIRLMIRKRMPSKSTVRLQRVRKVMNTVKSFILGIFS